MPHMSPMLYVQLFNYISTFIYLVLILIWSLFMYVKFYSTKDSILFKITYKWFW